MGMLIHRENVRRRMAEEQAKKLVEQAKPLPEAPKSDIPEEPKKKGSRPKKSE